MRSTSPTNSINLVRLHRFESFWLYSQWRYASSRIQSRFWPARGNPHGIHLPTHKRCQSTRIKDHRNPVEGIYSPPTVGSSALRWLGVAHFIHIGKRIRARHERKYLLRRHSSQNGVHQWIPQGSSHHSCIAQLVSCHVVKLPPKLEGNTQLWICPLSLDLSVRSAILGWLRWAQVRTYPTKTSWLSLLLGHPSIWRQGFYILLVLQSFGFSRHSVFDQLWTNWSISERFYSLDCTHTQPPNTRKMYSTRMIGFPSRWDQDQILTAPRSFWRIEIIYRSLPAEEIRSSTYPWAMRLILNWWPNRTERESGYRYRCYYSSRTPRYAENTAVWSLNLCWKHYPNLREWLFPQKLLAFWNTPGKVVISSTSTKPILIVGDLESPINQTVGSSIMGI